MCKISVIVPVYNVERYLERCIESILKQTFTDFEIIMVDDGSKDGSGKICNQYEKKYQCIHVIHQENKGLALARKAGVELAMGEFIMFVDSDDWIHEDMLKRMYQIAKTNESAMVCCQYLRVNEKGKQKGDVHMDVSQIDCENSLESAYQMFVTRYLSSTACGKLIKIELFSNIDFKENLAIGEEHDMVTQLISKANKVSIIEENYYYYYWRTGSISHAGYNEKYFNSFRNYLKIRDKAIKDYIQLKSYINAYFAEYEMAVITAMCRNKRYDWNVVKELQKDLKENRIDIIRNCTTPLYLKVCAIMITICPPIFIVMFRMIHLVTGR